MCFLQGPVDLHAAPLISLNDGQLMTASSNCFSANALSGPGFSNSWGSTQHYVGNGEVVGWCSDLVIWKKTHPSMFFIHGFTQHQPLWWIFPYVHWHINQNIPELSRTVFWDPISMFPQKKSPTISHPSHLPRCSAWPLALRALRQGQGGGGVARGDAGDAFHEAGIAWEIAGGFPKKQPEVKRWIVITLW